MLVDQLPGGLLAFLLGAVASVSDNELVAVLSGVGQGVDRDPHGLLEACGEEALWPRVGIITPILIVDGSDAVATPEHAESSMRTAPPIPASHVSGRCMGLFLQRLVG